LRDSLSSKEASADRVKASARCARLGLRCTVVPRAAPASCGFSNGGRDLWRELDWVLLLLGRNVDLLDLDADLMAEWALVVVAYRSER
jgi:hypothetical protein